MRQQTGWTRLITRAYHLLLAFYPTAFRSEFGAEMKAVFKSALEEQAGEHFWLLAWREFRHWPGSVLNAYIRAGRKIMTTNGLNSEEPLTRKELLAAMVIFLLPMFSLFALSGGSLPQWANYLLVVLFWGSILFATGLAVGRKIPGWSLPYLGFVVMVSVVINPYWTVWNWIYPIFLNAFGAMSLWPVSIRILYAGIFEFIMSLTVLLSALFVVNLLRLLTYTRVIWEGIRADWTRLSFMIYGGLVFYIILVFEEYRHENLWKLSAWACLALGAWLYLRGNGRKQRIIALLAGTTAAYWVIALAKWVLIPLQMWPTGYPIAPSDASRWVETGSTLLSWLFTLGILSASALLTWLPPLPIPDSAAGGEPASASKS